LISLDGYVPIMFEPGWVLEKHWGWSAVEDRAGLKLLRRRRGPFTAFLLMTRGVGDLQVAEVASLRGLLGPTSITTWNDFSATGESDVRHIGGVAFRRVNCDRWFGVGTFVVDLAMAEDVLWGRMAERERTKCRRARSQGIAVELASSDTAQSIKAFWRLHDRMARERGLERPSRRSIDRMVREGDLLVVRVVDGGGRDLVVNFIYLRPPHACFLLGARATGTPAGAGHLAHWETIRGLQRQGFRWYDLGLVGRRDTEDGIYRFKRSLGGAFVAFGEEYRHVPRALELILGAYRHLRRGLRKL
jgi:hypothetical protein